MPKINPEILIWARTAAGLSEQEAAKKLGLSNPDRLRALESGERDPSRRQLVNMAEKYRRPLLTFYLRTPPRRSDRGQDFRTLHERQPIGTEALLDTLLRDIHARQSLVRAALEETEEDERLPFVGFARAQDGIDNVVNAMRDALAFSLEEFRHQRSATEAFSYLRSATERAGIFVLLMGNLGTHHTDIDVKIFRGFALADEVAPFVVINEKDSRAAWSFTLLHELAHVFLGQTGISGYDGEAAIEKFCEEVAARFLLDPKELSEINILAENSIEDLVNRIGLFANDRNLSRKMVAYNLLRTRRINSGTYQNISNALDAERIAQKQKEDERDASGVADYYVVRRHRLGPGLVDFVKRMVASGTLTTTKAGKVLGVKPTAVIRLVDGNRAA